MRTVIETPLFEKQVAAVWSEDERDEFIDWIARNPDAGEVIRGTRMGARKVRWRRKGTGKSSGVRVIYYHFPEPGLLLLTALYAKSDRETMTAAEINKLNR
jgi:hypothetical protein